jgi:hypothetical protein
MVKIKGSISRKRGFIAKTEHFRKGVFHKNNVNQSGIDDIAAWGRLYKKVIKVNYC